MSVSGLLTERLDLINGIQTVFKLFIEQHKLLPRHFVQDKILSVLHMNHNVYNKRLINESLARIGYQKVTIDGKNYFRRDIDDGKSK